MGHMGTSQGDNTVKRSGADPAVRIDRGRSARRIEEVLEAVSGPRYTRSTTTICRYAFTPEYANTVRYFATALEGLGYETREDPVGNFVARNRPDGEPTYGVGSHCDSNRNGGKYDGTLGVVAALELCRLESELDLGLPLQVVVPVEEEASGFGHAMLGSAIMAQAVDEDDLRALRAIDDGRSFWSHAEAAGFEPDRWRECRGPLEQMLGWLELHIEQEGSCKTPRYPSASSTGSSASSTPTSRSTGAPTMRVRRRWKSAATPASRRRGLPSTSPSLPRPVAPEWLPRWANSISIPD